MTRKDRKKTDMYKKGVSLWVRQVLELHFLDVLSKFVRPSFWKFPFLRQSGRHPLSWSTLSPIRVPTPVFRQPPQLAFDLKDKNNQLQQKPHWNLLSEDVRHNVWRNLVTWIKFYLAAVHTGRIGDPVQAPAGLEHLAITLSLVGYVGYTKLV